jgi:hypothetical protein
MGIFCLKISYIICVILISLILWKNMNLKINIHVLSSVIFYGWELGFSHWVINKSWRFMTVSGKLTGDLWKLHNKKLRHLYFLPNVMRVPMTVMKELCGLPYVMYEAGLQKNFVIAHPKYYTSVWGKNKYNHEYPCQCIRRFGRDFKWERPEYISGIATTPSCSLTQGRRRKCVRDAGGGKLGLEGNLKTILRFWRFPHSDRFCLCKRTFWTR